MAGTTWSLAAGVVPHSVWNWQDRFLPSKSIPSTARSMPSVSTCGWHRQAAGRSGEGEPSCCSGWLILLRKMGNGGRKTEDRGNSAAGLAEREIVSLAVTLSPVRCRR